MLHKVFFKKYMLTQTHLKLFEYMKAVLLIKFLEGEKNDLSIFKDTPSTTVNLPPTK